MPIRCSGVNLWPTDRLGQGHVGLGSALRQGCAPGYGGGGSKARTCCHSAMANKWKWKRVRAKVDVTAQEPGGYPRTAAGLGRRE